MVYDEIWVQLPVHSKCGFLFLMQADFSGSSVDEIVTPRNMGKCKIFKWNKISKLITYFCVIVSDVCNVLSSLGCINVAMWSIIREKRGWHVVSSTLRNDKRMSEFAFTVRQNYMQKGDVYTLFPLHLANWIKWLER